MATFTVNGYEFLSSTDMSVFDVKDAQLQFVAPLGGATLDFRYASDSPTSAEVALSDYNIILNGVHLNDGVLPERIELFDLNWSAAGSSDTSQVINLAYADGDGWRDCMFSVSKAPLPMITNAAEATSVLAGAGFSVLATEELENGHTIRLDNMPDVAISGIIQSMFEAEKAAQENNDEFDFNYNSDTEAPDMTEFDIAARAGEMDPLSPAEQESIFSGLDADTFETPLEHQEFDDFGG